jgi:alpha-mannosidase
MIYPHGDNFVKAEINKIAFEYNVPVCKADLSGENIFGELYMQTMKMSEKGDMVVVRLSEQNGKRGRIKLGKKVKLLNFLEDVEGETDIIEYKPFEIVTIGIEK